MTYDAEIDGLLPASSGRSRSPRKFPVSGRSGQHAEAAVAVDAWGGTKSGEAVEQLERVRICALLPPAPEPPSG